jgi:hypothetical protein
MKTSISREIIAIFDIDFNHLSIFAPLCFPCNAICVHTSDDDSNLLMYFEHYEIIDSIFTHGTSEVG